METQADRAEHEQRRERGCGHACHHRESLDVLRRDLHDEIGSGLTAMAVRLEQLTQLADADQWAKQVLTDLRAETVEMIAKVGLLARGRTINSPVENVEAALHTIVTRLNQAVSPRLTFTLNYDPAVETAPIRIKSAAFWIAREAIINVMKHSQAHSCEISLWISANQLHLLIKDDGPAKQPFSPHGNGLRNMRERAAQYGGQCHSTHNEPTGYTTTANIPLQQEDTP